MQIKIIKMAITIATLLRLTNLYAQEKQETVFETTKPISTKDLGFYVAPSFVATQLDGAAAAIFAIRGGISIKESFSFGAYYNTSFNKPKPSSETLSDIYLDYWTAGGFIEYTIFSKKKFHLTFPLFIGYGEVQMDNEPGYTELGEAKFLLIEPSTQLEINLFENVRFNVGAGYRFIGDMKYRNFTGQDISGITAHMGFKFGVFR